MRKLNENCVKLNVSSIKRDYPTLKINTMRDQFINAGASVTSEERESSINEGADDLYMVVNSLNESTVLTMCESIGIEDPEYYLDEFDETDDDIEDDELEEDYDEDEVRETVEDVVNNMSAEELTAEDAEEYILDRVLEYFPYPKNHEDIVGIIKEVIAEALEAIDDNDTEEDDLEYPDYDEVDLDEEDTNEFDEALDDIDEDDEWDADDELNDYDEFDECIQEKKQSCCPPKKGKMVNLSESLKKLTISDILADVRKNVKLNESISNKALLKAKAAKLSSIKESLGIEKANLVISQVKARSPFLYENKKINGKFISEYTTNELLELLEKAKVKKSNTLNESADFSKVERLLTILDEELTYRLTIEKYLNEDDEDPFAMLSVDPKDDKKEETSEEKKDDKKEESSEEKKDDKKEDEDKSEDKETSEENPEEDETAELSRIIITLANIDAANDLKQSLLDEGVPEEAIEIEDGEEDSDEDEETEESDKEDKETSESIHFDRLRRLFEDDEESTEETEETKEETDDAESDSEEGDSEEGDSEKESEEGDSEEEKEAEGSVKLILVDTDYTDKLQAVLKNIYGIEEDEFEEMIGGEIVDEDEDEDADKEESDGEKEESEADKAADEMDPSELFNGL